MKKELDDALVRDFPNLYRNRNGTRNKTMMCYGFNVDDGWEPVIRRLSEKLEPLVVDTYMCTDQVKQKFGGLRFYMTGSTDEMNRLIREAEEECWKTCEACGQIGSPRNNRGAMRTLCDACLAKCP